MKRFFRRSKLGQTNGQVSIFLVFLFQILFVFFAMVINVGLLVYYKINLQNSVDLAAYYGAMKQAEMLNTIGHINYQIRQSWKLLAFRTSILGALGPEIHPAFPTVTNNFGEVQFKNPDGTIGVPIFCITIAEIYGNIMQANTVVNDSDNQCLHADDRLLAGFDIPNVIWGAPGFNQGIRDGALILQDKFLSEFAGGGFRNFSSLASFIIMFRADSMNRRKLMAVMANKLSENTEDFPDIDSQSVKEGIQKVLKGNLASENQQPNNLDFTFYNSLANQGCGGPASDIEDLPGWLKEVEILPLFFYFDSSTNAPTASGSIPGQQQARLVGYEDNISLPSLTNTTSAGQQNSLRLLNSFLALGGLPNHEAGRWTSAVGVEKNPWCMPYVGVKATSRPRLPFMPSDMSPKLEAKAFAKPFGSSIGPWHGKTWSSQAPGTMSDFTATSSTDTLLPIRMKPNQTSLEPPPQKQYWHEYMPNYSRFIGDRFGLTSQGARQAYGRFFWQDYTIKNRYWTHMWRRPLDEAMVNTTDPSSSFYAGPLSGDILADAYTDAYYAGLPSSHPLSQAKKYAMEMRKAEMAAIAPDLFDITYYPIEPRFNQVLQPKLAQFAQKFNTVRPQLLVRGDLGWRSGPTGGPNGDATMNVETQISIFKGHPFLNKAPGDQIFQTITDTAPMLTSWAERSIVEYNPNYGWAKLGTCEPENRVPAGEQPWTPGACIKGGRTGYSVKIVSKKFLDGNIPNIGGQGVSGGILNPPPSDF